MEAQEKSIQDYLAIVSRRKVSIITTALSVFLLGLVVALIWPPTYKSSATILIKEQEIPTELVRSTVTSFASQRIQTISQRVMTRPNLLEIIGKYNLYVKDRKRKTSGEVLAGMRNDIGLDMISADVVDPRSGRPGVATIAFKLSYQGKSPGATQKVAGELTSLYLAENFKIRKDKAAETYTFLTDETVKLQNKISESEKKLAKFKELNANSLPEVAAMNLSFLNRTESDLDSIGIELKALKARKLYLLGQLEQVNPLTNMRSATGQSILDPASRLKALESEYVSLSAKYAEAHPDIVKIKREIKGLREQTGLKSDAQELAKTLTLKRSQYGAAKQKYSADYPDSLQLKAEIEALEKKINSRSLQTEEQVMILHPDNPAYIAIKTQLQAIESEMMSNNNRKIRLNEKLMELEERIARSPQVEKLYLELSREYQSSLLRFRDIKARQMDAEIGQQMEKESKGESFILIDPAQYPERPVKPNRMAIIFLAFFFSIAIGFRSGDFERSDGFIYSWSRRN